MALVNVAYNLSFGWTRPQVRSLEAQMLEPMLKTHPVELGMKGREGAVSAGLAADPQYRRTLQPPFAADVHAGEFCESRQGDRVPSSAR